MQTRLPKFLTALVVVLALAFPLLLALEKMHESDAFWHLKTGEWILTHAKIPRVDSYSSTVAGKPWLDWEWLFQAVMYVVYAAGGFNALVIAERAEDPSVYWFLARLLAGQGRTGEAVQAYEDCLRLWVGSPEKKEQIQGELHKLRDGKPKP